MSTEIYLGLGANLGNPRETFDRSLSQVKMFADILNQSSLYRSKPYGFSEQPSFVNAAIRISSTLPPLEILKKTQQIEKNLGKKTLHKNGPRVIDLDLLIYDDLMLDSKKLVLPHPGILKRDFVILPLLEIKANLAHPAWPHITLSKYLSIIDEPFVIGNPEPWQQCS